MARSRFRTCFISAPLGVDTTFLRKALDEKAIKWSDITTSDPRINLIDSIERAITKADFLCAVFPQAEHGNVFFELGIAYAKQKPILALLAPSASLSPDIALLTYFRADPTDADTIRSALAMFLQHASDKPARKVPRTSPKTTSILDKAVPLPLPITGKEFEFKTAQLFQAAGFIVSLSQQPGAKGADLAVWVDELSQSLGNPLLVEVKAGELSNREIYDAASQLRQYVTKTRGRSGLLVYWDRRNREFPAVSRDWPLIFQLSGETLERLLQQRRLPEELVRLRNVAAHGEV